MDDQEEPSSDCLTITSEKIEELKQKYSQQLKDSPDNPLKICMRLIFEGATQKDTSRRSTTAHQLSEFLTRPNGVINLFLALIDFDSSSQKVTTHNQRFVAVAHIITRLPKLCMSYEDYCLNIYKQLRPLIYDRSPRYATLAAIIMRALLESPHAKDTGARIKNILTGPLLDSLRDPSGEYQLDQAIVAIHNLTLNHFPVEPFIEIFPHLMIAAETLSRSPSSLKPYLMPTLVSILNSIEPGAACCLIEKTIFYCDINSDFYVIAPQDDKVSIKINESTNSKTDDGLFVSKQTVLSLLESCDNELLVLEFYFHFQDAIWTAKSQYQREFSASLIEPFLLYSSQEASESKLDIFNMIATNRHKSLELITRTLLNHKAYLSSGDEDRGARLSHIDQSLSSCISILEVLCATICEKDDEVVVMTKCYPLLKELSEILSNIPNLEHRNTLDSIESFLNKLEAQKSQNIGSKINTTQERQFAAIIKDLNDQLIPVRVHAIVRLRQMVLSNDPFIIPKIPQLYSMIECSLAENEPYVFLACINLLAEMAVRKTSFILPKMIELYGRRELELQNRINVGEVMMRLLKQLNETTPYYAQQVMSCLLNHSEDPEELIRMSSLTNIGEICKRLGASLGNYIVEILARIRAILDTDTLQVKCAAVDLLRTALSGADLLGIEAIQRELKEIYLALKLLRRVALDNKLCLQIDLALDEIDRIAREMLVGVTTRRPTDEITKNIRVLSLL